MQKRTIIVLVSLAGSMTAGMLLLMAMTRDPIRPSDSSLAVVIAAMPQAEGIDATNVPLNKDKWKHIIIHSSTAPRSELENKHHFIVEPPDAEGRCEVVMTSLWRQQESGKQISTSGHDYDSDSIGVCLVGDFSSQPPSEAQLRAATQWVRALRKAFGIELGRVYMLNDLDSRVASPGDAFPVVQFNYDVSR